MKITRRQLHRLIEQELISESIELSQRESDEAKRLLGMSGFQLQQMLKMTLGMGAQPVYEKVLGHYLAGAFGEAGKVKASEIMSMFPQLTPIQIDDREEQSAEMSNDTFEEGAYLSATELESIMRYINILRSAPVRPRAAVTQTITREANAKRDYRGHILELQRIFERLKNFGSHLDASRGVFFGRGGLARAQRLGYIVRPEDGAKLSLTDVAGPSISHTRLMGTRHFGEKLVKAIEEVPAERRY